MNKTIAITAAMIVIIAGVIYFATMELFLSFAAAYPIVSSFFKFFVLATLGDLVGLSIRKRQWTIPEMILPKAFIWGLIGIVIYFMFQIFPYGIFLLQQNNILPFAGSELAKAFFISLFMNVTFAPTMMDAHRISDTFLNERAKGNKLSIVETIDHIDWGHFTNLIIFKTIPFFWIPAHTITFLLPPEYRVLFAAVLGIVLGILLGFGSKETT